MSSSRRSLFRLFLLALPLLACASRQTSAPADTALAVEANEARAPIEPCIAGVVCDANGVPIEGATVWAHPAGGGWVPCAKTERHGRFRIALRGAPSYDLRAEAPGYGQYFEQARLSTDFGTHLPGEQDVRIELQPLRATNFIVLDERTGLPVPEFELSLRWKSNGGVQRARAEVVHEDGRIEDGSFTFFADPELQTYVITAPGYVPERGEIVLDAPDATDCTLRLLPFVLTKFVAVDARTGAPISKFRLILDWKRDAWAKGRAGLDLSRQSAESNDGAAEYLASPDAQCFSIESLGYESHRDEIAFDAPDSNTCTVRLKPTSVLRAHLSRDPWSYLGDIRVYRGSFERAARMRGIDVQEFYEEYVSGRRQDDRADAPPIPSLVKVVDIDDDDPDVITIEGLPPGEYYVESWCIEEFGSSDGQRLVIDPIDLAEFEVLDLGTIRVSRGAQLSGRVVVPDGVDPRSIELRADSWNRASFARPLANGAFQFGALPAGRVRLSVAKAPAGVVRGAPQVIELSAGGAKRVEFDVSMQRSDG